MDTHSNGDQMEAGSSTDHETVPVSGTTYALNMLSSPTGVNGKGGMERLLVVKICGNI